MAKKIGTETKVGIDHDGDGKPDFHIDLKTIGMLLVGISTVIGMWFTLQGDIEEAKKLPHPPIDRTEYDLKDELIRQTIMSTQDDVKDIKSQMIRMEDKIDKLK